MKSVRFHFGAMLFALAALFASAFPARAFAQQDQIAVGIEVSPKIYVGDASLLKIVVHGSGNAEPPDLSFLKDFEAVYQGSEQGSSMTIGAGGTQVILSKAFRYAITPKHAGTLDLPAITLVIDGHSYTTQPVQVEATEPASATDFKLQVSAEPAAAFVGQPIHIRMSWTLGKDVRDVALALPFGGVEHDTFPDPALQRLAPNDRERVQVRFNGEQVVARFQNPVLTIDRVIVPTKPGTLVIGPARADFLAVVGQRPRHPLDSPWGDFALTERQFSSAAALTINVDDLPTESKPANFSGLVGAYQIAAGPNTSNVSVGDPINLSVTITGPYPLSLVPPLDLARQSALRSKFRIPREPCLPQVTPSVVVFNAMLRARSPDATEIGPISLSYFDPDAKQYKFATTAPIPIIVHASANISLPDQPDDEPSSPQPALQKRPGGLPDIDRSPLSAGVAPFNLNAMLRSNTTLALLILPPATCALAASILAFLRWRERDPAAHRRRAALAKLRRDLNRSAAGSLDPIARALSNFAADSFDQPRDTLTGATAAALLAQSQSPAGAELADLIRACDESRFGLTNTGSLTPSDLIRKALSSARRFRVDSSRIEPSRIEQMGGAPA